MGRKWGQHFLNSQTIVDKISRAAILEEDSVVLEIGPGEGVITLVMTEMAARVHAFEIDPSLADALEARNIENLILHRGDFLKQEFDSEMSEQSFTVVANLPYYITAPILEKLFWQRPLRIKRAVLMMQDEVAQRVCQPASRLAGALTYIVGADYDSEYLFEVGSGCFSPPPKVTSAVIALTPRSSEGQRPRSERVYYERLVKACFQARRKQLGRSLRALRPDASELLEASAIDPKRRPETLSIEEFWTLARNWYDRELTS